MGSRLLTFGAQMVARARNTLWYAPFIVWTHRYDRLDLRPGLLSLVVSSMLRPRRISDVRRRWLATRLPVEADTLTPDGAPIDLLVISHPKDFSSLPLCINSSVQNSRNQIAGIFVVVPDYAVPLCQKIMSDHEIQASVIGETRILERSLIADLEASFGQARHGWILQQLLTITHCLKSSAKGVLVVNADTIITRPRVWLDSNGTQSLLVSSEHVAEYYAFLADLGIGCVPPQYTFVTHHMLFQPDVLRELCAGLSADEFVRDLASEIIKSRRIGQAAFCVEFELYAQHLVQAHPSKYRLVKFANRPVYGDFDEQQMIDESNKRRGSYSSVSFHAYLRE